MFFVLSGFVLTRAALNPRFDIRAYYPSRLVRLYAPVAAAVAFAVLLALLVPRVFLDSAPGWLAGHRNPIGFTQVALDVTLLGGPGFSLNSALWSLRWEVVFSLLLPLYVVVVIRIPEALLIVAAFFSCTAGAYVTFDTGLVPNTVSEVFLYLPIFLVGSVLAVHLHEVANAAARLNSARWSALWWAVILLAAVLALTLTWSTGHPLYSSGTAWTAPATLFGATMLVIGAIGWPRLRKLLEIRQVQWLGKVSFSLYLIHEPIVVSIGVLLPTSDAWASVPLALLFSLPASWLFYRLVERPSHRLAQKIALLVRARVAARSGDASTSKA